MHLKYVFACLTSAAALTAGMSASEVVDGLRKISENSAVLHSSFDTIDNNTPILGLWNFYSGYRQVLGDVRGLTKALTAVPSDNTLSDAECTQVSDALHEIFPVFQGCLGVATDKKPLVDSLSLGPFSASGMAVREARNTRRALDDFEAALVAFTPGDCMVQVRPLVDQYIAAYDTLLSVYQ